jgi:hypothetical protein
VARLPAAAEEAEVEAADANGAAGDAAAEVEAVLQGLLKIRSKRVVLTPGLAAARMRPSNQIGRRLGPTGRTVRTAMTKRAGAGAVGRNRPESLRASTRISTAAAAKAASPAIRVNAVTGRKAANPRSASPSTAG